MLLKLLVKFAATIILIILVEFLLVAVALRYTTDLEETAFTAEVVLMSLTPIVIPLLVFRNEAMRKVGKKKFWIGFFFILGIALLSFVYFWKIIMFLF